MSWVYLIGAGIAEMTAVFFMGKSKGYQILKWSILSILSFALSFYWLSKSLEDIPLSLAYSIWVGIGAAGGVILGMLYLNESKSRWRIFYLMMIIGSVVGLKVVS
ncbi:MULTISPECIES: multidrug efflux SMR transporter [Exiguobacterium]|jgi:quaternary ammonium compound-resistance protein SugE/paired small multidrug resistance pump|uniref:DMT family transporter n=1 Tax=Exiguobacterium TaxID=33986 RepID=UPI00093F7BA3|nr:MULTISPECIES: multidrug efflux SMR transporter [Exiguobacterium]MCA0982080.1 multidrug efflux SMR transporter [Exiguobacterium aestuarii]MDA5561636.1 multidrug efflux SMR transporter [Exiguobacterium sp. MMG028]MDE0563824.1 multidrug efflux SMR transporter [Exiguobacterium sp. B2(2022)]